VETLPFNARASEPRHLVSPVETGGFCVFDASRSRRQSALKRTRSVTAGGRERVVSHRVVSERDGTRPDQGNAVQPHQDHAAGLP